MYIIIIYIVKLKQNDKKIILLNNNINKLKEEKEDILNGIFTNNYRNKS